MSHKKSARSEGTYAQESRKVERKVETCYPFEEKGLGVLCG
jgi:hypothetical protein